MSKAEIRHDQYHGRRLYVDGLPDPFKRGRVMYVAQRKRGWSRTVALAVALHIVCGSARSRRYLVAKGWEPGAIKGLPEDWKSEAA